MKVAVISNSADKMMISGYKLAISDLIYFLRKIGHEVLVIQTGTKEGLTKEINGATYVFKGKDSNVGYISPIWSKKNILALYKVLHDFSPDIIHIHDPLSLGTLAHIWAIQNNIPSIYTSHSLPSRIARFGLNLEWFADVVDTTLLNQYMTEFLNNSDRVIVWNKEVEKDVKKIANKAKTVVFKNAIRLEEYFKVKPTKFDKSKVTFAFLGMYTYRKNQKFLIEVFKHLPEHFELNLYGPISRNVELFKSLQSQARDYLNIKLHRAIKKSDVPKMLGKNMFFISASKLETHSLVVTEALAGGTPVITHGAKYINTLVDESIGKDISRKTSPKEFAEKLEEFINNLTTNRYKKLVKNARNKVVEYDWNEVIIGYEKLYQQVIKEHKTAVSKKSDRIIDFITLKSLRDEVKMILGEDISAKSRKKKMGIITILIFFATFIASVYLIFVSRIRRSTDSDNKQTRK